MEVKLPFAYSRAIRKMARAADTTPQSFVRELVQCAIVTAYELRFGGTIGQDFGLKHMPEQRLKVDFTATSGRGRKRKNLQVRISEQCRAQLAVIARRNGIHTWQALEELINVNAPFPATIQNPQ